MAGAAAGHNPEYATDRTDTLVFALRSSFVAESPKKPMLPLGFHAPGSPSGASIEYWSAIICGDTYAPTVMGAVRHPGAPSDDSAGPSLPADVNTVMLHFRTASSNVSATRPDVDS